LKLVKLAIKQLQYIYFTNGAHFTVSW